MATDKPLLLSAILGNIEVEGDVENGKQYSVRLYVADKEVAKSTKSKPSLSVLKWEWNADNTIWFEPSSMMKVALYRVSRTNIDRFNDLVGQHEGKVVDLLENNASFDLTDKKGSIPAKMKIFLSRISGESVDDIKKFMEKVDDDVRRLSSNDAVTSTVSTLGQVLKLTKTIMDQLSQVHPILKASWTIVSIVYQAVQETDLQDESIRELAITLREMLGTANAIPDLPVIPHTTDVIEAISRQSLQVASLIHEYTKLPWIGRTVKIQIPGDLKSRIDECQKSCAALKDGFYSRLHLDTNTQVKETGRRLEAITLAKTIHSWLSPPDSSRNWNEAYSKRQVDTCSWFLESERFLRWRENPGFLWVKGKPGCGKSVLCSSIVDSLLQLDPSPGIAYFFFDGRDSQTELQSHYKLIRSLISQLSDKRYGGIPVELVNLHRKYGAQQPLDTQLQDTLRDILDRFSHAYIVIDALDECIDRKETLNWVNKLVTDTDRKAENLHIVVTSRPLPDIENVFGGLDPHSINVVDATANQDIVSYLNLQMESKFKGYDEETLRTIKSGLTERADGSFRWVALQLAALERCSSTYEIMQQLADLPDGLDETYKRILKEIDRKYRADTRTFLQWLAFSNRSIKIPEIAEAITVDFASEDGPVFNLAKRYINPRDVLARCSSLVDESEGTIRLSHFSVKEYLLSTRVEKDFSISEETSHSKITEISVAYLLQFDSFLPLTKAMLVSSPLAQYAADYWINHAKSGGMGPTVLKLILRLFTSETGSFTNWIRICNIDVHAHGWDRQDLSMDKSKVCSPLYYASLAGMQPLLDYLLEKGVNVNAKEGRLGSALQAASSGGHEAIVKLLLEKGADVNAQGGLGSALLAASFGGYEAIVKLLLGQGANVNAQGEEFGSALHAASFGGHEAIVKLLLEKGANVNAQGEEFGSALHAASFGGHEVIVKLLLEKGANVNTQGELGSALHAGFDVTTELLERGVYVNAEGYCGEPLQAASSGGHEAIVKLLFEKGANVNAQGYYGTALHAASSKGHEAIVKLLLEKGANVNVQGYYNGDALQAASYEGQEVIIKLLLEKGADVNAQGGHYGNALQAASASYEGQEVIIKLLLEKGADVNAQGGHYGNALQAASDNGHEAIVKLLLEKGAIVNAQGGFYGNALQAASSEGHEVIVKLLLEKGANVNAQGGIDGSALQAASSEGHEVIVKLLLEKGANVNAQGGVYGSALQAASSKGHEAIVKLLLEKGANVNAQGEGFGSALQAASSEGHEAIVKLLLEKGANVNAQEGEEFGSALRAASSRGHEAIVKLLLEHGAEMSAAAT